jgi:hypothetical protein
MGEVIVKKEHLKLPRRLNESLLQHGTEIFSAVSEWGDERHKPLFLYVYIHFLCSRHEHSLKILFMSFALGTIQTSVWIG